MAPPTRNATKTGAEEIDVEELINKVCSTVLSKIEIKMDQQAERLNKLSSSISKLESKINEQTENFDKKLNEINESFSLLNNEVLFNKKSIKTLDYKCDDLEQHNKRNTLRFHGISEESDENIVEKTLNFINSKLNISCAISDIDSVFRIGEANKNEYSRVVLVNFTSNIKRNQVFAAKRKLKNSPVSIFEDLTKKRYDLLRMAKKKYPKNNVWSTGGKVYVWCDKENKKKLLNENVGV